jgi:hypothetical protein
MRTDNHFHKFYLNGKYMDYIIKSKGESKKNMSFNIFFTHCIIQFLDGNLLYFWLGKPWHII